MSIFDFFLHNYFLGVLMPRDFKSFINQNKHTLDENKDKVEDYQNIINKYKDMDNNQLMQNLFKEASKLKQEGKLKHDQLENLSSTLSPFLNDEQKDMLESLIKAIDN